MILPATRREPIEAAGLGANQYAAVSQFPGMELQRR